jgi:hypothetical protein
VSPSTPSHVLRPTQLFKGIVTVQDTWSTS